MKNNKLILNIDFIVLPNEPVKVKDNYIYKIKVISEKGFKLLNNKT